MGLSRPWRWAGLAAVVALLGGWWLVGGDPTSGGPAIADGPRLERGNGAEPDSLDPQLARIESALTILRDTYEGLTRVARDGGVEPGVASAWEVSADGLRYRFVLRPEARWSNGDPVTAGDFVAAWRRLVDPATASPYGQLLEPVAGALSILRGEAELDSLGVLADGPHVLEVTLLQPTPYFPALLSHPSTFPVHRPSLEARGRGFAKAGVAVTNGPYVPLEWQVGTQVTAGRNRYFREAASVQIPMVRYHHIPDPLTEYTRYRAGDLHVTYTLPNGRMARLPEAIAGDLQSGPQLGVYYYGFAVDRPPFAGQPGLRRALSMAIDRDLLTARVLGDGEVPAWSWVPPGVDGYAGPRVDWADWSVERRLAEARRLYAEAGYSVERPLEVEIAYNKSPLHDRIALVVSAMWKQHLGVRATLRAEEFRVLRQRIDLREAAVFRASWLADYNDAYSFLQLLRGGFGINLPRYANAGYDRLLDEAALTPDRAQRSQLLAAAEQRLLDDVPILPLYFYVAKHLVSPRVGGWYANVMNVTYSADLTLDAAGSAGQ